MGNSLSEIDEKKFKCWVKIYKIFIGGSKILPVNGHLNNYLKNSSKTTQFAPLVLLLKYLRYLFPFGICIQGIVKENHEILSFLHF